MTVSQRLRKFIDDSVYPPGKPETMKISRAELEQTTADEGDQVEKLAGSRLSYLEQKLAQLDQVVTWLLGRLNKIEERME